MLQKNFIFIFVFALAIAGVQSTHPIIMPETVAQTSMAEQAITRASEQPVAPMLKIKRSLQSLWERMLNNRPTTAIGIAKVAAGLVVFLLVTLNVYNKVKPAAHSPYISQTRVQADGKTLIVEQIAIPSQQGNTCGWHATNTTLGRVKKLLKDPKDSNPKESLIEPIYPATELNNRQSDVRRTYAEQAQETFTRDATNRAGDGNVLTTNFGQDGHWGACGSLEQERLLKNLPPLGVITLKDKAQLDHKQQQDLDNRVTALQHIPTTEALEQLAQENPQAYQANVERRAFLELNHYHEKPLTEISEAERQALYEHVKNDEDYTANPYEEPKIMCRQLNADASTDELDTYGVEKAIENFKEKDAAIRAVDPIILKSTTEDEIEKNGPRIKQDGIHGLIIVHSDKLPVKSNKGGASIIEQEKKNSKLSHWTSLVINRDGTTVTYDIADSLGNIDHRKKGYLFSMLEKYESPALLAAYEKELAKQEPGIITKTWHTITHVL